MIFTQTNGLKGHQHTAQGITLGRRMQSVVCALKGQKHYIYGTVSL